MKAAKFDDYGNYEMIYLDEIEIPKVKSEHLLVKIHASSINMMDIRILTGNPPQIRQLIGNPSEKGNILGSDLSGVIEGVGPEVNGFKVGDEVFGQLSINQSGGFAEYALVPARQLAIKSKHLSHSQASTIPLAGVTALQALRKLNVQEGSKVLIYGASGGVGTFAIQLAKAMGARVTGVCSTRNYQNALNFGADRVIDYKKEDWYDPSVQYDGIFIVNGYNPLKMYLDSLVEGGKCLVIPFTDKINQEIDESKSYLENTNREVIRFIATINPTDYQYLSSLAEEGKLKPYVDKEFPLKDINSALKYFMEGKKLGKTVVKML